MFSILVAGLAKTGTTGLYNTIKTAVPPEARYLFVFEPKEPAALLAPGRYAPRRPILTKILMRRIDDCAVRYPDFDRRIMMVRDPRDIAVSRLLYRPLLERTAYQLDPAVLEPFVAAVKEKEADPASRSVKQLHDLADKLGIGHARWPELLRQMNRQLKLLDDQDFFIQHYEDFIGDEMEDLRTYLDMPVHNTRTHHEGWTEHVQRSMAHGDWKHWFTDEDVEFFGEMFSDYMRRFGYSNRERAAVPRIDPATASEYVTGKVAHGVAERRKRGLGRCRPTDVRTMEELERLTSLAEDGRATWCYRVALVYLKGIVTPPDETLALTWARHAATFGHLKAMALAADLLDRLGTNHNDSLEARFWRREHDRLSGTQRTSSAETNPKPQRGPTARESEARPATGPSGRGGWPGSLIGPARRIRRAVRQRNQRPAGGTGRS